MAIQHSDSSFLKKDKDGNVSMSSYLEDGDTIVGTGRVDNLPVEKPSKKAKAEKADDSNDDSSDDKKAEKSDKKPVETELTQGADGTSTVVAEKK